MGTRCSSCGYAKNTAALVFHHMAPEQKQFQLDLRNLSNRNWVTLVREAAKCIVLCANCHAEHHYPECAVPESE